MKKTSIEEKAKAYDEAIEKAKEYFNSPRTCFDIEQLCNIFPELKESDDEKMELLEHLKSCLSTSSTTIWKKKYQRWIAWLEKQGEQKPADKVEPKFKVGDWVVNTVGDTNQVVKVLDDGYTLDDNTFLSNSWATEHYHLWTIQDAKDGDVLFTSSTASHETFIFKSIDEKGNAKCYFTYDSEDGFREGKYHFIGSATNCKPATKEQCDLLFQKMKEAGYEWDAEKKELKRIEDENYDGEDYGIDSLWHAQRILEKTLGKVDGYQSDDGILAHKCAISAVKQLYEQKPAWNEDDERMIDNIIFELEENQENISGIGYKIDWLKSLKDRHTWKPSGEQVKALEYYIRNVIDKEGVFGRKLAELYEDLWNLREE